MGTEQHLVTLARVGHQSEGPAGAQLHMRDLHAELNAAYYQAFFAPVKLERLTPGRTSAVQGP